MTDHERIAFLQQQLDMASARLGEHFEVVQIIAVSEDKNASLLMSSGVGGAFARRGVIHEFLDYTQMGRLVHASMEGPAQDGS